MSASRTWNVMATVRHQEASAIGDDGKPIYEEQLHDRIWLEGYGSSTEALRVAAAVQDSTVTQTWIQPDGEIVPDPEWKNGVISAGEEELFSQAHSIGRRR